MLLVYRLFVVSLFNDKQRFIAEKKYFRRIRNITLAASSVDVSLELFNIILQVFVVTRMTLIDAVLFFDQRVSGGEIMRQ